MKKYIYIIIICAISLIGLYSRYSVGKIAHPDQDDIYQLVNLQHYKLPDILKNDGNYGDHTSFPGEFIVNYIPMRVLNIFENRIDQSSPENLLKDLMPDKWRILLIPHMIIVVLGFVLFYFLCEVYMENQVGRIVAFLLLAFNNTLIFHAFGFRPYAVLPTLAIANLLLASYFLRKRTILNSIVYSLLFFFTCIYHAYGILIAGLPLLFICILGKQFNLKWFFIPVGLSILAWAYYASHNTFGVTPNTMQSQVEPFRFLPKHQFWQINISLFFGNNLLSIGLWPFVLIGLMKMKKDFALFFFLMIMLPLVLICLVDIKTHYWILQRQYIWLMPWFAVFVGKLIERSCDALDL